MRAKVTYKGHYYNHNFGQNMRVCAVLDSFEIIARPVFLPVAGGRKPKRGKAGFVQNVVGDRFSCSKYSRNLRFYVVIDRFASDV
jgi:hypothetical protein